MLKNSIDIVNFGYIKHLYVKKSHFIVRIFLHT